MATLFFGKKETLIKHIEEVFQKCPACETNQFAELIVYSQYFHFYFIPMWPLSKDAISYCKKCGFKRDAPFDKDFISDYAEVKKKFKHPLFTYIGLIIISLIVLSAIISGQTD